ncbi:TetR/AcrR family transcriptional regulator [Gordonia sinesedis]
MSNGIHHDQIPLRQAGDADVERADAARNRALLLTAAKTLIDNHGAAAVTMDAVAREAGVGKGTVFRRFGSRTGLMFALLDHAESELQLGFLSGPPPLGPGAEPLDRLLAYGRARLAMTAAHLDVLLEAGAGSGEFMNHPVWRMSTQHVQILLRQLGFGDDVTVTAIAVQTPLGAATVRHLTANVGLDVAAIADQWEHMVRSLVAGRAAAS